MTDISEKYSASDSLDYIDVETDSQRVIITLNWERLIVRKEELKKIEFEMDKKTGRATKISIQLKNTELEIPVNIFNSEAEAIENKSSIIIKHHNQKT